MEIKLDDLTGHEIRSLLEAHLRNMHAITPPESIHALDIEALRNADISFWTVWDGDELLGCGALKELAPDHGEIKSMRTADAHRRKGVGKTLLAYILTEAKRRGFKKISLETGAMEAFVPAQALYASFGFSLCGPFGDYREDPNSVFMCKEL